MISAPIYFYPNRMGRIVLLAIEEILGHDAVNAILNLAHLQEYIDQFPASNQDLEFPLEHAGRLQTALECAYGPRGGRGLSLRVGRACLKYSLREFGSELGMTDLAFRMLPLPTRLKVGSEALAGLFNQFTDQRVSLEVDEKHIYWHIKRCPLCWERQADGPCCALAVGFLQEALYWVSGGKYFLVEEKNCIACGDSTCTIVIDQTPMS
jgi:predicted hydrocarbon binding protein